MFLSVAPRPAWRDLVAAGVAHAAGEADLRPWGNGDPAFLLSRAAWGFAAAAAALQGALGRRARIWIPGYFCNGSLQPLRRTGALIVFYPVTCDAQPDWDACRTMAAAQAPDAFVLVHTFGWANDLAGATAFAAATGALLIEDGAHVLRPAGDIGRCGGLVLYSPYKMLPIPDGGVVAVPPGPRQRELAAACAALDTARHSASAWLARRVVEKLAPAPLLAPLAARRGPADFAADPPGGPESPTPRPSAATRRMLPALARRLDEVAARRLRNAIRLARLAWPAGCRPWREAGEAVPYRFVLRCESEPAAAALFRSLRNRGVPAESWPDLPPEVTADPQRHVAAITLRRTLLLLPVHQDLDPGKLEAALAGL